MNANAGDVLLATGALRELCAVQWVLLQQCHDAVSVSRASTFCGGWGSVKQGGRKKKKHAATRDRRQHHPLMDIGSQRTEGEPGLEANVRSGIQASHRIRHGASRQQERSSMDQAETQQGIINRYTLQARNSLWLAGEDDLDLEKAKEKEPVRQTRLC
ncbi:hypothetical protein NDU88_005243 [Pleurodeles waltl]|uniref:Uncharacterized protein n=1 Tax=Pleurodeles waltl TaxID=8319 RepID=A0AAV7M8Q5_PLEWA|nr:hypothetical protein NDU88_005243 [Pleurodeles waltl]